MVICLFSVFLCQSSYAEYIFYDANELPTEANPPWERQGQLDRTQIISDAKHPDNKLLWIVSKPGGALKFTISWKTGNAIGSTVVIRCKLNSGASFIAFDDGTKWESFEFIPDEAYALFSNLHSGINPGEWHTYRLTLRKEVFSYYVDENPYASGESRPVGEGGGLPPSNSGIPPLSIRFGQSTDLPGGIKVVEDIDWLIDFIYFDQDGISPLPREATFGLEPHGKLAATWGKIKKFQ
jgi:hypothetical protein